jgi:hypothetical protein
MRFLLVLLLGTTLVSPATAQEHWQRLPGAASAYAVDLGSLALEADILSARIRTHDIGSRLVVQEVQCRCAANQLRTVHEVVYDADTRRPLPGTSRGKAEEGTAWPEYVAGSEGHALLSGLCTLARERKLS